ncbi:GAF domain-containing protein [Rathayibacter sp. VKM Ac-2803]|uniref:GAF and ANTAR domain-containing protein n=1 Tax=Rathayibacter sp. VKM Ac-2803 TaxID=2609256 RepID=UPI00135AABF5|nr:GAF and ANTAR domain-containing protein [Rathayibacter sp. VKM Ac-2803]MWV49125.1 GAF domain-containing protein [Rathayibacter sp. VKM Ac-2803]
MPTTTHEQMLLETLTAVADTLVDDFDIVEFLHDLVERCAAIFDAVDVGIVLADPHGDLVVMASTSERMHLIEALQLSAGDGPCMESYTTGSAITAGTLDDIQSRWPAFAEGVGESGYQSVHAVPLRLQSETIGSLNFFSDRAGELGPSDVRAAQTIADVATIGLVQQRTVREASVARDQLQLAVKARVLIEQAKGAIAHSRTVDMETAWDILRDLARSRRASVSDTARGIIDRVVPLDA